MSGAWTKVTVVVDTANLDKTAAILSMLDNGLMIEDYSDFSFSGMYGELVDDTILNADTTKGKVSLFVPEEKQLGEYLSFINEHLAAASIDFEYENEGLNEEDWADSWKKYFKPMHIGRITVAPSWESYTPAEGEVVVKIDPGMAFGTGTHETTRLCLSLLQEVSLDGTRVLDLGCGSGILSIAAARLSAAEVYAYDIDPVAVNVTRENARICGINNIEVGISDLLSGVRHHATGYDICVANIVADIILRLLPDLPRYIKRGAPVILSGIVADRAQDVIAAAEKCGFKLVKQISENDWIGLLLV